MIRQPAVAGSFYSASPEALAADLSQYMPRTAAPQAAIAVVSPHAGLMYSGHVAGAVYARVIIPGTAILIGPNHSGLGPPISVYPQGSWLIPGDSVPVDADLAETLLAKLPQAKADTSAHLCEHCLEVQLPFLRRARNDVRIVPILLGAVSLELCRQLGACLARIILDHSPPGGGAAGPLLIASTDLTHYEPDQVARMKDRQAIAAIERLDPTALSAAVREQGIAMCGFAPTMTVLHAARALGATTGTLVRYATSGDISHDRTSVVGYAGLTIA